MVSSEYPLPEDLNERAENLFRELRETRLHVRPALQNLLVIYEQERDWQACLEVTEALEALIGEDMSLQKSHYHCELALSAQSEGRTADAQASLTRASAIYRNCLRAHHLQAQFAAAQGDYRSAIRALRQAAERDANYLPEVLPEIVNNYRQLGDLQALRQYLEAMATAHPYAGAELALADLLKEQEGTTEAADYLAARLAEQPNLTLLLRSLELDARMTQGRAAEFLASLRPQILQLLEHRPVYQCAHCGFAAKTLHWQCPSCRRWSTIKRKPVCDNVPGQSTL